VADRAAAQQVVAALRSQHPAAVDDGEPSGTAGRPMLEVLRHQDLDGVLATVVRYYGGVNLGAGGLVRAYTDCIAQALQRMWQEITSPIFCCGFGRAASLQVACLARQTARLAPSRASQLLAANRVLFLATS
jgi:putative IMPACT (imprinted ancient) family translation regulator